MAITRWTTPQMTLLVKGVDITAYDVYVTIRQWNNEITVSGDDLAMTATSDGTEITLMLTQEQAGSLNVKKFAQVQVNYMVGDVRNATEIANVNIYDNLLDEVIA